MKASIKKDQNLGTYAFINEALTSNNLKFLRAYFKNQRDFIKSQSGTTIKYIQENNSSKISNLLYKNIGKKLIKNLRREIDLSIKAKEAELKESSIKFSRLKNPKITTCFLSFSPKAFKVGIHLDNDLNIFQILIYLGSSDNKRSKIAQLLNYEDLIKQHNGKINYNGKIDFVRRTNFPDSKNAMLIFLNTNKSYHCVPSLINDDRLMICMGISCHTAI